ncbi:MAG TPA: metallophosphoesterase family protein [Xanthobacteraceae bacterium]|nr:metallophosphoesterase family protein [Xanthobacteraceae bacterium]
MPITDSSPRLAVISDIHGNVRALEAVLADIRTRGADAIVNLGDCVTSPLWPRETCELLASLSLVTVRGNHDRALVEGRFDDLPPVGKFARAALNAEQRETLGRLPVRVEVEPGILAVHGTPDDDSTFLLENVHDDRLIPAARGEVLARLGAYASAGVVLCGHSHNQQVRQVPGRCFMLNPGSVGCPAFADHPAARRFEYRSPHACYAILTRRHGRWGAELLALEYDWTEAARRAAENGRPDWAQAYAVGSVG